MPGSALGPRRAEAEADLLGLVEPTVLQTALDNASNRANKPSDARLGTYSAQQPVHDLGLSMVVCARCGGRDTGWMGGDRVDFFVSHAGADRAWAEWAAWQLSDAGYSVELDVWDWPAGANFVLAMSDALARCDRALALLSSAYFERRRYTTEEWTAALAHVSGTGQGRLVPVRVEHMPAEKMPAVLRSLVFCDLAGLDAAGARQVLLETVEGPRRPDGEPVFPGQGTPGGLRKLGGAGPRLPAGSHGCGACWPEHWVHRAGQPAGGSAEAAAGQGSGGRAGVPGDGRGGQDQVAIEYAYRFSGAYDLGWWVDAEQAGLIGDQFAALGAALGCVPAGADMEAMQAAVLGELRERQGGCWSSTTPNPRPLCGPGCRARAGTY